MRGVSQTLARRVAVLPLDPLSVSEVLGVSAPGDLGELLDGHLTGSVTLRFDLGDWLFCGAYPEPRFNPDVGRDLWMESYVQTYHDAVSATSSMSETWRRSARSSRSHARRAASHSPCTGRRGQCAHRAPVAERARHQPARPSAPALSLFRRLKGGWRKYFFHMEWWTDATPFSIVDGSLLLECAGLTDQTTHAAR